MEVSRRWQFFLGMITGATTGLIFFILMELVRQFLLHNVLELLGLESFYFSLRDPTIMLILGVIIWVDGSATWTNSRALNFDVLADGQTLIKIGVPVIETTTLITVLFAVIVVVWGKRSAMGAITIKFHLHFSSSAEIIAGLLSHHLV
jgi:hypothetical protein